MEIRVLKPSEIECRVQSVRKDNTGCSLVLYKDARCDMRILDEVFGPFGWEREHQTINGKLFCSVRIYDYDKDRWITKQDVGVESNTEAVKGEASDSFKRACVNVGIGRELYTSPFVWVKLTGADFNDQGKLKTTFHVKDIDYNKDREISYMVIEDNNHVSRWQFGKMPEVVRCSNCDCLEQKKITDRAIELFGKPLCAKCGLIAKAAAEKAAAAGEAAATTPKKKGKAGGQ